MVVRNRFARAIAEAGRRRSRHLYWLYPPLIAQRLRIGGPTVFWRVDRRAPIYLLGGYGEGVSAYRESETLSAGFSKKHHVIPDNHAACGTRLGQSHTRLIPAT